MVRGSGRSAKGLLAAAAVVLAGVIQAGPAAPATLAAATGLAYTSTGTWTVDPALGRVHVDVKVLATSHAADTGTRRYYYSNLQLTLPTSTQGYKATDSSGNDLPVTVVATVASGVVVDIDFGQRLYAGQSMLFDLKFDVVDMGGSTDRDLRIGLDIVSFPVKGFGSPATPGSSVTVAFPPGFAVQEQFGTLTSRVDSFGNTIFASGPVPDAYALTAWFTGARNVPDADFQTETLAVGPIDVTLRYWSDDPGWANQVGRVVLTGYPILRRLIGLGDPAATKLTIEEATSQGIGGFSGEYDPASSLVQISYFADPIVVLHELAHLWFNENLASDRWINEGFASYYAEMAVLELGLPDHAPALGPSLMAAAEPLNSWTGSAPGSATEAYLYGASLQAARDIAALAGTAGLSQVWAQARARTSAYADPAAARLDLPAGGVTDWRRLLDYLELTTGKSYVDIWVEWVVTPAQASALSTRDDLLADYSETGDQTGGWTMPTDVRVAMGNWQFGTAQVLLNRTRDVLGMRQQITSLAAQEDTTVPPNLMAAFERGGTANAVDEANLELQALDTMVAAEKARASSQGAVRIFGLIGTDPDSQLSSARDAFARGDVPLALSLAESARSAWVGAAGTGQLRVVGLLAGTGGFLLLLGIFIWTRNGKRRPAATAEGAGRGPARPVDA
jgi:hypothetical protein